MGSDEVLQYEVTDGVATLRFNRPDKLNALNAELSNAIFDKTRQALDNPDVRVLVYTGEGDAFAAGADINELEKLETAFDTYEFAQERREFWESIAQAPKPTVAQVNGMALGAGLEFCLVCDIRIASEEASFGLPEVKLGVLPGGGGTQRLPRVVGDSLAKEMIMTGDPIGAERAREAGIVSRVVPHDELEETVRELAGTLSNRAPLALKMIKKTIDQGTQVDLKSGLEMERDAFSLLFSTEDSQEGIQAFLEKRKPEFKGR